MPTTVRLTNGKTTTVRLGGSNQRSLEAQAAAEAAEAAAEAAQAAAEAARDAAVDISNIDTSDAVVEALVKNTAGAGPLTSAALSTAIADQLGDVADPENVATFLTEAAAEAAVDAELAAGGIVTAEKAPALSRNRAHDPQLVTTGGVGTGMTAARITTGLPAGFDHGLQATRTSGTSSVIGTIYLAGHSGSLAFPLPWAVTPGEQITVQTRAWTDQATARARLDLLFYDATWTLVGSTSTGTYTAIAQNTWETRTRSGVTVPVGAVWVLPALQVAMNSGAGNAAIGSVSRATGAMLVEGTVASPTYGDGTTEGWYWEGVENASESRQIFLDADTVAEFPTLPDRVAALEGSGGAVVSGITLVKAGNALTLTYDLGGATLTQALDLAGSNNGAFNIGVTSYGAGAVASGTDEVTPIRTQMGTVGANHGFTNVRTFTNPDAKDATDVGSVWTDGTREYVLLAISGGRLVIGGAYTTASGVTSSADVAPTVNLTHVSGATHTAAIDHTTAATTQLYPTITRVLERLFIDGTPVTEDGTYAGRVVTVRETYEILDYADLYDTAKANVGTAYTALEIDGAVKVTNTFRFTPNGLCAITWALDELKPTTLGRCGAVQAFVLDGAVTRYLPGVGVTDSGFNWTNGVDMATYAYTDLITTAELVSSTKPPAFALDVGATIAFALGYRPFGVRGDEDSRNSARLANASTALWDMRSTDKSYPNVIGSKAAGWGRVTAEAFRAFVPLTEATEVLEARSDAVAAYEALATIVGLT